MKGVPQAPNGSVKILALVRRQGRFQDPNQLDRVPHVFTRRLPLRGAVASVGEQAAAALAAAIGMLAAIRLVTPFEVGHAGGSSKR